MRNVHSGARKAKIDLSKIDEAAHYIPSGRNVWDGRYERFDLTRLRCYRHLEQAKRLERSLGTLGGGNHFIEIDISSDGNKYLVIHSGSRNLGKQVAEYYQNLAIELASGKGELFEKKAELIKTYKEQGRRTEIQSALKAMEKEWQAKVPDTPADLAIFMIITLRIIFMMSRYVSALQSVTVSVWLR